MKSTYSLLPIIFLVLLAYVISRILTTAGILPLATHRKIWNTLLLVTFLVTGILGLLLVVDINYKLEWKWIRTALYWHVQCGIAMTLIAIFHLIWHLGYYRKLFHSSPAKQISEQTGNKNNINYPRWFPVTESFLLGLVTMLTQLVMLRQFLNLFEGNELVIGIVLVNWMLLTGLGALAEKTRIKKKKQSLHGLFLWMAVIAITCLAASYLLRTLLFPTGTVGGLTGSFLFSFILLSPFCFLSGMAFTRLAVHGSAFPGFSPGIIYTLETTGSLVAGLLFTFVFIRLLNPMSILILAGILATTPWIILKTGPKRPFTWLFLSMLLLTASVILPVEKWLTATLYPGQQVLNIKESPYGRIVATSQTGQVNVFNNGLILYNTCNVVADEEAIHYPLVQCTHPDTILLISGDLTGMLRECKKYPVRKVDFVELNPVTVSMFADSIPARDAGLVDLHPVDPIRFLRSLSTGYDAVCIQVPEPGTIQENRFFSVEFFRLLKQHLHPGGIVSCSLPTSMNYLNREARDLNSTLAVTLKKIYPHLLLVPGERLFFLASDSSLNINITQLIDKKYINNNYVNSYYIDSTLLRSRSEQIEAALNPGAPVNHFFHPAGLSRQLSFWISQYHFPLYLLFSVLVLLVLFCLFRFPSPASALFSTGATGAGFEFLLIMSVQVLYGSAYAATGLIIALFMAGMALGAFAGNRLTLQRSEKAVRRIVLLVTVLLNMAAVLLLRFMAQKSLSPLIGFPSIALMLMVIAAIPGFLFSWSLRSIATVSTSGLYYAADLIGSALGMFLITIFVFPVLGLVWSGIILSIIVLVALIRSSIK